MSKVAKTIVFNALYAAVAIALVLTVWAAGAAIVGSEFVLPDIPTAFAAFKDILSLRSFWIGLSYTLLRSAVGFCISIALFAVLFYLSTAFTGARRVIEPIISAMRTLPTIAVALILAIWAGGNGAPVILSVFVIMPIMYSAVRARVAAVPKELTEVCRICGAGRYATFKALWFPYAASALPETLSGAFSYNIKAVLGAEILISTANSLGMLMQVARMYYETAMLIAMTLAAVVVSVVSEAILRAVLGIALRRYRD